MVVVYLAKKYTHLSKDIEAYLVKLNEKRHFQA
jgi:hypothetical protein